MRTPRVPFAAVPVAGLFSWDLNGMAIVSIVSVAIVTVVFALLAYVLITRRNVAPRVELGKLRIRFERLGSSRRSPPKP